MVAEVLRATVPAEAKLEEDDDVTGGSGPACLPHGTRGAKENGKIYPN